MKFLWQKTDWQDAEGTVSSCDLLETGRGGPMYTVVFTYKVNEHWCGGTITTGDKYDRGDTIYLRYDPKDPDRNDLVVKERRAHWIIGIVIVVGIAVFLIFVAR